MANTQGTTGLLGWIDERFPLTKMMREHLTEYYAPKEFQLLVLLRRAGDGGAGQSDSDRHLADHELQTLCCRCLRLGRIHHARRRLGLADPLHAFDRRVGLLHRGLPAHVPRADLRLLQEAA
jgi:hypothetical protein